MRESRRVKRLLVVTCTGLLLVALPACSSSSSSGDEGGAKEVIYEGYGGEYKDLWMKAVGEPFERETGIKVVFHEGGSAEENLVKVRSTQGDPGFDVGILTSKENIVGGNEGFIEKVSEEQVPNLADVYPELRESISDHGVVHELQPVVMMYDKEKFSNPPQTWKVMWDDRYKKGTIAWDPANILGIYQVLIAADTFGGDQHHLQPGWDAMERLAGSVLATPESSSQAVPYLEKRTATAFPYWVGRAGFYSSQYNYGYTVPNEGTYVLLATLGVPSDAKNKEAAYKLIDYWLRPEVQERWSEVYYVVPSVENAQMNKDLRAHEIPDGATLAQGKAMRLPDDQSIIDRRGEWLKQWSRIFK